MAHCLIKRFYLLKAAELGPEGFAGLLSEFDVDNFKGSNERIRTRTRRVGECPLDPASCIASAFD